MPVQLRARPIEARTKGEVKRMRRAGQVPVSVQHRGKETLHLQEEARPLDEFIRQHGGAALFELIIEPENRRETVYIRDIQRDPITRTLLHVSLQSVDRNEKMKVQVPLVFLGEPEEVRQNIAFAQHILEQVEIQCLPKDLPEYITVDISHLTLNDAARVSDLPHNEKIEILTPPDTVLATLTRAVTEVVEEVTPTEEGEEQAVAEEVADEAENA